MDDCLACSVYALKRIGISGLKVVGRNLPSSRKVKDVLFINIVRNASERFRNNEEFCRFVRKCYKKIYKKDCPEDCLYSGKHGKSGAFYIP